MLNISVAPQIRSSGESTAALISAGSSGTNTNDAVTEDFGKVLDRQVSEATDKQDKHKQNDATNAADQERSDNTIPEKIRIRIPLRMLPRMVLTVLFKAC